MKTVLITIMLLTAAAVLGQTVKITVNPLEKKHNISPYIYGRNDFQWRGDPKEYYLIREAGVTVYRQNQGNNATKYNWRKKLSSHPDWYNNVYYQNWDSLAYVLAKESPSTQGFFAFQLLGKVASTDKYNFDNIAYDNGKGTNNQSNWAGGGGPSINGQPEKEGNAELYLEDWPADSTTAILDHWFRDLQLDSTKLRYWNMDNEPDFWRYFHNDALKTPIKADEFLEKYISVAKLARKKFPGIKLVGFVAAVEQDWYLWNDSKIKDSTDGKNYTWIEYFIRKIAEEQKRSGVRLLDILDVHFYPSNLSPTPETTVQFHRIWFDTTYYYPGAYGVKAVSPRGWDNNIKKEYFFLRVNRWLDQYLGKGHQVTLGVSETGGISSEPNVVATWYAGHLGTFASNNVELFTPFFWYPGMWEVLHLFTHYNGKIALSAASDNEDAISAHASLSGKQDTLVVTIINKSTDRYQSATIDIDHFKFNAQEAEAYIISDLPSQETFMSSTENALQKKQIPVTGHTIEYNAPPLSVTLLRIAGEPSVLAVHERKTNEMIVRYDASNQKIYVNTPEVRSGKISILSSMSAEVEQHPFNGKDDLDIAHLPQGMYFLKLEFNQQTFIHKFIKL